MRRTRGFTLIELMVVIAIIGILATMAVGISRSSFRNARLGSSTFSLGARLGQLQATAMREGKDYLVVVVDAPGSNSSACAWSAQTSCVQYFVLRNPSTAWTLANFQPTSDNAASANAEFVASYAMPNGVHFYNTANPAPAPFSGVATWDADLTATCSGRKCFAIRFTAQGTVRGEQANAGAQLAPKLGYTMLFDSGTVSTPDRRGIVVSFPSGVIKTFPTS